MRFAIDVINNWGKEHSASAVFSCLYIQEAHATDEWPINSARCSRTGRPVCFAQHKSLGERINAAREFIRDYDVDTSSLPFFMDDMTNTFQTIYAAWPLRWFVFRLNDRREPVVRHIGQPEDASFDLSLIPGTFLGGE